MGPRLPAMRPSLPDCPYPGIASFTWGDQDVFFAREDEARRLIRLIVLYRGVLLYSSSGTGKSSLINARVLPMALEEGFLPARLRVQPRRGEEIQEILVEPLPFPSFFSGKAGERVVMSVEELLDKLETLRGVEVAEHPLLIFDQFEEWVTLFEGSREPHDREARDRILNALVKLLDDDSLPVKILLSLREDYLARLEPLFERCPALPDQYVRLTALDGDQVEKVIRGPFEKHRDTWKTEISPALAKELRRQLEKRADSEGVAPTEVQIVCLRLFHAGEQAADQPEDQAADQPFDPAAGPTAYFESQQNGVKSLLEGFLEECLDELEPELHDPAVALLAHMLTSAGTRNVIDRDNLIETVAREEKVQRPLLDKALDQLEEKTRLVQKELRRNVFFYEIVSEFLVDWIHDRAEELRLQRARRQQTRFSAGRAAFLLAFAIPILACALAFLFLRKTDQQNQLRTSQFLSRQAETVRDDQLPRGLLLAVEAVKRARPGFWLSRPDQAKEPPDLRVAADAEEVLRRVLARVPAKNRASAPPEPQIFATLQDARLNPFVSDTLRSLDQQWAALSQERGLLSLWDLDTKEVPSHLRSVISRDHHRPVALAPQATWLLTVDSTLEKLRLWDLRTGSTHPIELVPHKGVRWAVFSLDDRWLATGDSAVEVPPDEECGWARRKVCGSARLWDLHRVRDITKQRPPLRPYKTFKHQGPVTAVAFSPNSNSLRLATGGKDETAFWILEGPAENEGLPPQVGRARALAFSPDGQWQVGWARALAFSPDGQWLATGSRQLQLWRLGGDGPVGPPVILLDEYPDDRSRALMFDSFNPQKSRWLFTLGPDGAVRRWTLDLQTLRDLACRWAGRNLMFQEWRQYLDDEPYQRTCPTFPDPSDLPNPREKGRAMGEGD
jgi:hypothetical protein